MSKRLQGLLAGIVVGVMVAGGIAYAVTVIPPNDTDRYYACVSTAGVVQASTIKLNVEPTSCRKSTDTVASWNAKGADGAQGPAGADGADGAQGLTGDTGADAVTTCLGILHIGIDLSKPGSTPGNGCDLSGANLAFQNLSFANLENANLTYITVGHTNLTGANLTGANLTGANWVSNNVAGTIWNNTTCPNGQNSDSYPRCGY